jgi:hypothetical protein
MINSMKNLPKILIFRPHNKKLKKYTQNTEVWAAGIFFAAGHQ